MSWILALSIYDSVSRPNSVVIEAVTQDNKEHRLVLKASDLEKREEEIYKWLQTLR